jgi:hypothetical protein
MEKQTIKGVRIEGTPEQYGFGSIPAVKSIGGVYIYDAADRKPQYVTHQLTMNSDLPTDEHVAIHLLVAERLSTPAALVRQAALSGGIEISSGDVENPNDRKIGLVTASLITTLPSRMAMLRENAVALVKENVLEGQGGEQILVANTVKENLKYWDVAIAAHVESIYGEYLYDANQKVPGGVDFVGSDIEFKDSVPEEAREKIQELVDAALSENIAELTELEVYCEGVLVDRATFEDEESRQKHREEVLDHQKGNPMATQIDMMRNPERYEAAKKIMSGEVVSNLGIGNQRAVVGIKSGDKTHGVVMSTWEAGAVKLGSHVEVQMGKDGPHVKELDDGLGMKLQQGKGR